MTIRSDNADLRLTEKGRNVGAVTDQRWAHFVSTKAELSQVAEYLRSYVLSPQGWQGLGFDVSSDGIKRSAFDMLRHREVTMARLVHAIPELRSMDAQILARVEIDGVYSQHLRRQQADLRVFLDDEALALDPALDYATVEGLSSEVRERLAVVRPASVGAAKRMEGMTPSSIVSLLKFTRRTPARAADEHAITA